MGKYPNFITIPCVLSEEFESARGGTRGSVTLLVDGELESSAEFAAHVLFDYDCQ